MKINFFNEVKKPETAIDFITAERHIRQLLKKEGRKLGEINITFTSNEHILEVNKKYLNHNYFTDIITFNNGVRNVVSGDLLISMDEVAINARKYQHPLENELLRVILHGVLHLVGYDDSNEEETRIMRKKEDTYLCEL